MTMLEDSCIVCRPIVALWRLFITILNELSLKFGNKGPVFLVLYLQPDGNSNFVFTILQHAKTVNKKTIFTPNPTLPTCRHAPRTGEILVVRGCTWIHADDVNLSPWPINKNSKQHIYATKTKYLQ